MDWHNYISFLSPAASSGTLYYTIRTEDAATNITFTVPVSATAGDSVTTMAYNTMNAFRTVIAQQGATYTGMPVFSDQQGNASFYIDRTDNIVSLWSQSRFTILNVASAYNQAAMGRDWSNDLGCYVKVSASPTLITLDKAVNYAPMLGLQLEDLNENLLSSQQILDLMEICSNQIIRLVNNNFVVSCYLHEHIGSMNGSIQLRCGPILDYDTPMVRRPYVILITAVPLGQTKISYQVDRKTRFFNYRFTNDLIDLTEPMEMNNEFKMTYRAGLMNIPTIVKEKVLEVANLSLTDTNLASIKGGTFAATFRLPIDTLKGIALELRDYRLDPS